MAAGDDFWVDVVMVRIPHWVVAIAISLDYGDYGDMGGSERDCSFEVAPLGVGFSRDLHCAEQ